MPPAILPGAIGGNRNAQPHCPGTLVGQVAGATDNRTPPVACPTKWRVAGMRPRFLENRTQTHRHGEHILNLLSYCAKRQASMSLRARRRLWPR
jgi:hypothetical protein